MSLSPPRQDARLVLSFAFATRFVISALLLVLPRVLPVWDESAHIYVGTSSWLEGFLRWDIVHFLRIAQNAGWRLEKDFAFMPGVPVLLHVFAFWARPVQATLEMSQAEVMVLGGVILANLAGIAAALVLHRLTYAYTRSASFSRLTALLYCIPPAPYVLSVPLTEPFFALFAFYGMLLAHQRRHLLSSVMLAMATLCRSNGSLLAGYLIWHMVVEPYHRLSSTKRIFNALCCVLLVAVVFSPFLIVQRIAFLRFCAEGMTRPWCYSKPPLIYSFVQAHYWDVGFLRYWTLAQSPLFALSTPVLALSLTASWTYYRTFGWDALKLSLPLLGHAGKQTRVEPLFNAALLPSIHLHTFLALVLLFASHVQICLRQASTNPVLFWYAAHLLQQKSKWGHRWIIYCVAWGWVSILCWSVFLPPA